MSQRGCQQENRTMDTLSQCDAQSLSFQQPGPIISQFLHLNIIVHLFLSSLDVHLAVPINISLQQFSSQHLSDIKKTIKHHLKKTLPYLPINMQQNQSHFFSVQEGSTLYLQENSSIQHLFKQEIKLLRLQENISYFGRSSAKRNETKGKFMQALRTQRNAYLLPRHRILTRGRQSILSTIVSKLAPQMILMTNQVQCLSDRQISEPINQIHQHNNIYGSIVRLQYSKNNQDKIIQLYQNCIVLYSRQNPPFVYQQATAAEIAVQLDSGQPVYIFDSKNNYHKVTKTEIAEPKLHTFYSVSTKSKESQQMLVIDDIRILNSINLVEFTQMVVFKENDKKLHVDILFVFKEEINYQHYSKNGIGINQYMQKLSYKSHQGLEIYINHNIPNIQTKENYLARKDYYLTQFWLTIQANKVMSISCHKIQEDCVIYFQEGVTATYSAFFSKGKNMLNFKAKVNHYFPSKNSQKEIVLPKNSYFLANKHQPQANSFEIAELQAPQANSEMYILWLDDHPTDTISLASQIETNINIINVITVKHAVSWLKTFYLYIRWKWPNKQIKIITDMQLKGQQQAGADLIKEIHQLGINIPIMFFVSKDNALQILQRRNLISQNIGITAQRADLLSWCIS